MVQPRGPFLSVNAKQLAQPAFQVGPLLFAKRSSLVGHLTRRAWEAKSVQVRSRIPFCPRSSVRSERHRAKVEVAGASPAVDAILPLCLSSYRASFVNSNSSVRVRPEAPFHGDHDVTAASRPVTAFVPVRIRLVTPIWIKPAAVLAIRRNSPAHGLLQNATENRTTGNHGFDSHTPFGAVRPARERNSKAAL